MRSEYTARINRVIDHIDAHLSEEMSLDELAGVAGFSRFHFHRLFRAMVGETLGRYVARLRVERAASVLTANPTASITEVALDCAFGSSAAFARAFKARFGVSASEWRATAASKPGEANGKLGEANGNEGKAARAATVHIEGVNGNPSWRLEMRTEPGGDGPRNFPIWPPEVILPHEVVETPRRTAPHH
jgi:AraC family transcriptional regulator